MSDTRPLIAHVVYSFHTGGLENGVVNLINHLPAEQFRHAVIALTTLSPAMCARIRRDDVLFEQLHKGPGHALALYPGLIGLFRRMAPAIVHTRNLAALEAAVPAWLAGVPARVHGEHGWDTNDPDGLRRKYRLLRRLYRPWVNHYVALSRHLYTYLETSVGVPGARIAHICNGVDTKRFAPARDDAQAAVLAQAPWQPAVSRALVIGTVGRQQAIKDPLNLLAAFARLCEQVPEDRVPLRLMMVGDGPLHAELAEKVRAWGLSGQVWLTGEREDVPALMRAMDVFVLPSRAEGISNTILEAMATGLPAVVTDVGGNPELVDDSCGRRVAAGDSAALADALCDYACSPHRLREQGAAARARVLAQFSIDSMVGRYADLYLQQLGRAGDCRRTPA